MKRWLLVLLLFATLDTISAGAQNLTAAGNLTAASASCVQNTTACLILGVTSGATGSAVVSLTGTWSATAQFETSADNGVNWVAIAGTPVIGGTAVTSSTANGTWGFNVSGLTHIRVRVSAFTSGTVAVTINGSTAAASSRSGGASGLLALVASGTSTLNPGAVTNATCATAVTTAASGALTTDNLVADFTLDPSSTTGYNPAAAAQAVTIFKYLTAGNVNFKICNFTAGSITPGSVVMQWRVVR